MLRSQHAQALPATLRQHCRACLLASATALFTAAPSFYEALWPLAWVALVPLFVALREASPKRALLLGWWAETLMYWMGFYWLIGTMVRFGFIAVPLSVCFFAIIGLGYAGLLLLQGGYGVWRMQQLATAMQQASPLRVALIQPDIGMYEKQSGADREAQLDLQFGLSATTLDQHPELIIWPESMYPFGVPEYMQQLPWPAVPAPHNVHWLIGALTYAGKGPVRQVFNSALLLDQDGRILGRYDKQHLLAFGEYIPFQHYLPFLRHISPTIGNLTPGTGGIVTLPNGVGLGPLICYEDIVPDLARQAVRQGAQVLVNLTNDVWFGATRAPYQHRALAAFRAVENRVYLVRVTNTGLTSIIDALGREPAALPIFQADTLVHSIQPLRLASLYTRFGDWFAQLCSAVALLLPLDSRLRRRIHA